MYFQLIHEKFDGEESKIRKDESLLESFKRGCLYVMLQMNRLENENLAVDSFHRIRRFSDYPSYKPDYCIGYENSPKVFERLKPVVPKEIGYGHILTVFVGLLSFSVICVILYSNKEDLLVTHKYFWTNGTNLFVRTSVIRGVAIGTGRILKITAG